jgi:hypothetical protein
MSHVEHKDIHGTGCPAPNSVVAKETLAPMRPAKPGQAAAPVGPSYQVLITNETDPYDKPVSHPEERPAGPVSDDFAGTDHKAAKLSVSNATTERFSDLSDLIGSLVPDDKMIHHNPKISKDETSGRTNQEERNVRVKAFLFAASREADNDFHLIVGRDPKLAPTYMTMEISGLPPNSYASFGRINSARGAYNFFASQLPGAGYQFYRPPIPIEIEGSLFFDITHSTTGHPGPVDLRPDILTIWEVHPVTEIVFEP